MPFDNMLSDAHNAIYIELSCTHKSVIDDDVFIKNVDNVIIK